MAVTLGEVAKLETKYPTRKGIIQNMLRKSPVLEKWKFENVGALRNVAVRRTSLPDVAFRSINEGYTASEGSVEQVWETVYPFGGDIELDRIWDMLDQGNFIKKPKDFEVEGKSEAMAITFANYLINGDHGTDAKGFEGLKKRVDNSPTRQKVRAGSTTDVLDPTASTANARRFIDMWEKAHYRANSGDVQLILMNESMVWGFGRVLRYANIATGGGIYDMTKDQFDREVFSYKGANFVDMGYKADQSTEIIPVDETAEDAGSDATSVYMVPLNDEHGVIGIQLKDIDIYDPLNGGERESKPSKLIRVEWVIGLAGFGSYGVTRLHNIEDPDAWT